MRRYFLAPDVYWCKTSDAIVFLNLRRDRYTGLALNDAPKLCEIIADWPFPLCPQAPSEATGDSELALAEETLVSAGILIRTTPQSKPPMPVSIEVGSEILPNSDFDHRPTLNLDKFTNFMYASIYARLKLKYQPIHRIVDQVRARKKKAERRRSASISHRGSHFQIQDDTRLERVRSLTVAYQLLRVFSFTAKEACLFDSLALVEFLSRYDVYPDWIFGVRTGQFAAHSWVQHNSCLLNCSVELARTYTPILAV
jgi:hypothetical protein